MSDQSTLPSRAFRRLAVATFSTTILLIFVGGLVRVSDSGLGCGAAGSGTHGWPFCGGRVLPILDANQIVEYSHRALASLVGVMLLTLVFLAWRNYRQNKTVVWLSATAAALVIGEGILGGATVEYDLSPTLVATHLGISMMIAGALLGLIFASTSHASKPQLSKSFGVLGFAAPFFTWATIVVGGYVAGTEKFGSLTDHAGGGAHLACGKEFPGCIGSVFPFGRTEAIDIQLTHRVFMYVTAVLVVWLAVKMLRGSFDKRARTIAISSLFVLAGQILLGALNVWLGIHRGLILGHLALGTVLWLVVLSMPLSMRFVAPSQSGAITADPEPETQERAPADPVSVTM